MAAARRGGTDALLAQEDPGALSRLRPEQKRLLPDFLHHGAEAYGFRDNLWNCPRVASVIEQEFSVSYHPDHVSRLLKELHWTPQRPVVRALQRDEKEIEHWRRAVWPHLLRHARKKELTVAFLDESGFYLLPGLMRTYAPAGETPIIRVHLTRDHLSVMGIITPEGSLQMLVREKALTSADTIRFLEHIHRCLRRRVVLIWDRSPLHRSAAVTTFVKAHRAWFEIEFLPPYAPDLNPVEAAWQYLKNVELRGIPCRDAEALHEELELAIERLRSKPYLVPGFFEEAGLSLG
jgi:transposase